MRNDEELVYWRGVVGTWGKATDDISNIVTWFPGFKRLEHLEKHGKEAADTLPGHRCRDERESTRIRGRAAKRWRLVLTHAIEKAYEL